MLRVTTLTRKRAVCVRIDAELLTQARAFGINLSATLESALVAETKRRREAKWLDENREALEALNAFTRQHGLFGDSFRRF